MRNDGRCTWCKSPSEAQGATELRWRFRVCNMCRQMHENSWLFVHVPGQLELMPN